MSTDNFKPGDVFADIRSDFAFKRAFGTPKYKDATIGLLNAFITDRHIVDVSFDNTEILPETSSSRKSVIDVLCTDDTGAQFIVEMQKMEQVHFRERAYFYASKVVASREDVRGKDWDYSLPPTYFISFLDFRLRDAGAEELDGGGRIHTYSTVHSATGTRMPGSTEFHFIEMKDFDKKLCEITGVKEFWLYLLLDGKNLRAMPAEMAGDKGATAYFEACKRAAFTATENKRYLDDMVTELDKINGLKWAEQKGEARGRAEVAKAMKEQGLPTETIVQCSGLSKEQVLAL